MTKMQQAPELFGFDNSYARLPGRFYQHVMPVPVERPALIAFNAALALELGLHTDDRSETQLAAIFAGNEIPKGAAPLAMAYAGHQFGHYVPQLGDGRALLLGEVIDRNGIRRDIQLKGSGPTPFSRNGDGRAALGPVMREYIISEAMHALGIRTTRSLAAVITGERVLREMPFPGAVLTRVASSHIRIGTFEYFAAQGDMQAVRLLADYVIGRLYPEAAKASSPYITLLEYVMEAQAALVASWMHAGFIHGVMNTDNMALSGETIDYGPCAFMDHYDPMMVFSSIDRNGRYAFGNQAPVAQWNLARFAETLLPLLDSDADKALSIAEERIKAFPARFHGYWLSGMRRKLGLFTEETTDIALMNDLLVLMHRSNADYTITFRLLCGAADVRAEDGLLSQIFSHSDDFGSWMTRWRERLGRQNRTATESTALMQRANPAYIPRNHRVQEVIEAAVERNDFSAMKTLMEVLSRPYQEQDSFAEYARAPLSSELVRQTFCGT